MLFRSVGQLEAAGILGPDRGRNQGREVYPQGVMPLPSGAQERDGEKDGWAEGARRQTDTDERDKPGDNNRMEPPPPAVGNDDTPIRVWM